MTSESSYVEENSCTYKKWRVCLHELDWESTLLVGFVFVDNIDELYDAQESTSADMLIIEPNPDYVGDK